MVRTSPNMSYCFERTEMLSAVTTNLNVVFTSFYLFLAHTPHGALFVLPLFHVCMFPAVLWKRTVGTVTFCLVESEP
jgi:hypothetical protein